MKRKDVCPADCPGRHSGCHAECARYLECRREALECYKKKRMDTIQPPQAPENTPRAGA